MKRKVSHCDSEILERVVRLKNGAMDENISKVCADDSKRMERLYTLKKSQIERCTCDLKSNLKVDDLKQKNQGAFRCLSRPSYYILT